VIAFVRHGRTAVNCAGKFQGRTDPPLDEVGREQAARVAGAFASQPVARVVASPLQRAVETATTIAAGHGLSVTTDDRLIELDYGDWDERGLADIPADAWATWRADPTFAPPGGESLVDVTKRVISFCTDQPHDELVVAVSHVSPIKSAVCWALDIDERATFRMFLDLVSVSRVDWRADGSPFLAGFNQRG
jgi:probable phosphoglycerate mutase